MKEVLPMDTDPGFFSALRAQVEDSNRLFTGNCGRAALCVAALAVGVAAGCGSGGTTTSGGGGFNGGNTLMTVVASSAANDQLTRFSLTLNSLTLTEKAGTSVAVVNGPQQVEFIHLNGGAEPLLTVSVPQGVYTSATATVGGASFTCAVQQQGSDTTSTYAYGATPSSQVTVNLPQPLTVSGDTMAVSLQLVVSQSASFPSNCYDQGAQYSITPTFNLAAMTVAAQPANATNGKMTALEGLVQSTGGEPNSFTVASADGTPVGSAMSTVWRVNTSGNTVFQGIGNAEGLTSGMPVDMDGMLQADGSVLATRVAVPDASTTTLTVNSGPLDQVTSSVSLLSEVNQEAEGSQMYISGWPVFNFSNTTLGTWGGLTNVASLPFAASFNAANMVPGQMVAITTHATQVEPYPTVVPATVETLMPQTINGTVEAVGTAGAFTTYTVELAPYDLFPQFAVQAGEPTVLTNPQTVVVYADTNTQVVTAPSAGSVARFTGVIFDDNGTLRMDCTQVLAGVAE
jgi:hypothetical protein